MFSSSLSAVFILLCFARFTSSHVALTFPPARPFAFDFLDNVRSSGPCGVEYNRDHQMMTSIISGKPFTVTWHIAYPHMGGIKIQLMDKNGKTLSELTNSKFIYQNDTTALSREITLDSGFTCEHCVLRIIKQAAEWTNRNSPDGYLFWSCADITVFNQTTAEADNNCYEGKCLNGGSCKDGICKCMDRFEGKRCEFENDCEGDDSCGHGRCLERQATTYPKKLCFCEPGWMGRFCTKESPLNNAVLSDSEEEKYFKLKLYEKPAFHLYWKMIEDDEIEIALRVKTNTWIALGWRPEDTTAACKGFPINILPKPEVHVNDDEANNEEVASDQPDEDYQENDDEGSDNRRRKRFTQRQKSRSRRNVVETTMNYENVVKQLCEAGNISAAADWARQSFNRGLNEQKDSSTAETEPHGEPEPTSKPEPTAEPEPSSEPEPTSEPEPALAAGPEPESEASPNYLHPMDCSDIVYAMAEGNLHCVIDGYTRDRSTPKPDHWYGGVDDLTAAVGKIEDGVFHLRFRRKLKSEDLSDNSILDNTLRLIWARGQTPQAFYHKPLSGLERCKASNYDYYSINELKYHGTKPSQRGSLLHNFYDDPEASASQSTEGSFQHPPGCLPNECQFKAEWLFRKSTRKVHFKLEAKVDEEQWAGIGFSKNRLMEDSDAVVGWVDSSDGKLTLTDRWLAEKSSAGVALDNGPSSLENARGSYYDGKLHISFSRLQDTNDPNDMSLSNCVYFIYAWGGGLQNGDLSKHRSTAISEEKICIGSFASKAASSILFTILCIGVSTFMRGILS